MAAPCLCSPSSAHPLSVVTCWIGAAVKVCLGCGVSCRVALTYRLSHILVITNQRILALQAFHLSVHCYLVETSPSVPSVFYFFQRPPLPRAHATSSEVMIFNSIRAFNVRNISNHRNKPHAASLSYHWPIDCRRWANQRDCSNSYL